MRVLVYCPVAPKTPKIYGRTLQSIFRLDWSFPLDYVFGREDHPAGTGYENIRDKHNHARRIVLNDGYDAVLFVEADMVIPSDALRKLVSVDADVAYGLYVNRHGWRRWLAFTMLDRNGAQSLSQKPDLAQACWGSPIETQGAGMGCTLIRRHVLEKLEFRLPQDGGDDVADDWMFALDCQRLGLRQVHHLGVVCGHISPNGVLWPDPEAKDLCRTEFDEDTPPAGQIATKDKPVVIDITGLNRKDVYGWQTEMRNPNVAPQSPSGIE